MKNFVEFFGHFAADSLFQSKRVCEPLAFITTDPDDDFSILETTLDLNQWFAFKPGLPPIVFLISITDNGMTMIHQRKSWR